MSARLCWCAAEKGQTARFEHFHLQTKDADNMYLIQDKFVSVHEVTGENAAILYSQCNGWNANQNHLYN